MPRDNSVAGVLLFVESEVTRTMLDKLIEFLKCAFIEQKVDPFTRRHLAGSVLLFDARWAATLLGSFFAVAKLIELGKFRGLLFL